MSKPRRTPCLACLVHLPLTYNPDARGLRLPIEAPKLHRTAVEIASSFGGATFIPKPQAVGFWLDRGALYEDTLSLLEVDIPNTPKSRASLVAYVRDVLLPRFEQEAIRITFVEADATNVTHQTITKREARHGRHDR